MPVNLNHCPLSAQASLCECAGDVLLSLLPIRCPHTLVPGSDTEYAPTCTERLAALLCVVHPVSSSAATAGYLCTTAVIAQPSCHPLGPLLVLPAPRPVPPPPSVPVLHHVWL